MKTNLDPTALGKVIGQAVREAVDARLGTNRPATKTQHMALPMSHIRKFMSNGKRVVAGIASTDRLDFHGDVVVPRGGDWQLPIPLLWMHRHDEPIGVVRTAVATATSIEVECEFAEGIARADEAWKLCELAALSFSVGFIGREGEPIATGTRWTKWTLVELSAVACPANPDAKFKPKAITGGVRLRDGSGSIQLIRS